MTVSGYIRQSSGQIVTGHTIQASDFNNEYNALATAFDAGVGHTHDGTVGGGQAIGTAGLSGLNSSSSGLVKASGSNTFTAATLVTADIAANAVTYAKIQATSQACILGSTAAGAVAEIPLHAELSFSGGSLIITAAGVTNAMLAGSIAASKLIGTDIATIGTVTAGTWNATVIAGQYGGTGVANTGKTITLGGNLTTSGAFATTLTVTNTTSVTLPTAGTLATLAGSETFTNKTLTSPTINTPTITVLTNALTIEDNADTTKTILFSASGNTTGKSTTIAAANALNATFTLPAATDTLVGRASTDTLTNKTFDTAGTGNSFKINGTAITATTGSGSVVLATSPTLVTPTIGAASGTSLNLSGLTASQLVQTDGSKNLVSSNALPNGTTATTQTSGDGSTKVATTAYADAVGPKAWGYIAANGTVTKGYNVSSVTANGSGSYTVNFTNALSDGNYAVVLTIINGGSISGSNGTFAYVRSDLQKNSSGFSVQLVLSGVATNAIFSFVVFD